MSGGHFNYSQMHIEDIIEEMQIIINKSKPEEHGDLNYKLPDDIIKDIKEGILCLKKSFIYTQRIDYLVSGDDGEASFRSRLKQDLDELNESEGV